MREGYCFPARRPLKFPGTPSLLKHFWLCWEHIHHSPAHLSPSALYLSTESVKRCLLQNWLFVQAHTATPKHLKKAGEQNWPAKPGHKAWIKSREQWIQEDHLETQCTSGVTIRLMCQMLSSTPQSPLNGNYLMLLPLNQYSEIHSWKGFTWNYLKITSLFYASRKYAWISSLLIISTPLTPPQI